MFFFSVTLAHEYFFHSLIKQFNCDCSNISWKCKYDIKLHAVVLLTPWSMPDPQVYIMSDTGAELLFVVSLRQHPLPRCRPSFRRSRWLWRLSDLQRSWQRLGVSGWVDDFAFSFFLQEFVDGLLPLPYSNVRSLDWHHGKAILCLKEVHASRTDSRNKVLNE